jgi:hypothetical protein
MAAKRKDFSTQRAAEKAFERLRAKGIYDAGVVYDAHSGKYRLLWNDGKSNPGRRLTKAQKRVNASKRSKQRRIAKALRTFLKAQNPASKYAGAKIRRNKGSITIIPIKLPRRAGR